MSPTPTPAVVVTAPEEEKRLSRSIERTPVDRSSATTPSPKKKHSRFNSWAHSLIKPKPTKETPSKEYNSSSSDTTPENNRVMVSNYSYTSTKPQNYKIPEAIIDLDLASGVHYDPANSVVPTKTKAAFHRRTESAPELEDFFKYKSFTASSDKNSRRNSAIFEEEEDDEDGAISSTSSTHQVLNKNPSLNSINSATSSNNGSYARVQSPNTYQSITSTPTSTKTRRGGASAARYQSYYNNNSLLASALKSSESLSQVTGTTGSLHKPSYGSFHSQKSTHVTPTSLPHSTPSSVSTSSSVSSPMNSPSRFKFESRVYDIAPGQHAGYAVPNSPDLSSTPKAKIVSSSSSTSPSKRSVTKSTKSHKKSNSLLNTLSMKIRGGSFSSTKSSSKIDTSTPTVEQAIDDDEELEGDSTLTPFNFGEPGPALDLTTMTPKFYNDDYDHFDHDTFTNTNQNQSSPHTRSVASTETPKKSKKSAFLNWMKK